MTAPKRFDQLTKLVATLFLFAITAWQLSLLAVVILGLLPKPIDWGATWDNSEKLAGVVEHVATVAALILGGFWTYYRFIKGRVLKSRLELGVLGEIISLDKANYLRISVTLKNVGSSKVELAGRGDGLDIFSERSRWAVSAEEAKKHKVRSIKWDELGLFDVLEKHAWIEPGETVHDQTLVELLTREDIAYKIDLVLFAAGTKWTATSVILPRTKSEKMLSSNGPSPEEEANG